MWLWLEFCAHGGVHGGGSNHCSFITFWSHTNILRRIAMKHKENAVFERQQIEAPVETLVRGS